MKRELCYEGSAEKEVTESLYLPQCFDCSIMLYQSIRECVICRVQVFRDFIWTYDEEEDLVRSL